VSQRFSGYVPLIITQRQRGLRMDLNAQARSASATRPANNRARATNSPRRMSISGRTALGRRVRDLAESFAEQLGGWQALSEMATANVRKAAELSALAEQSRTTALRDGCVDALALVRLEGAANRAVRALGLPEHKAREPAQESFAEVARRAQAAEQVRRTQELAEDDAA
jgi:hypothetical protein